MFDLQSFCVENVQKLPAKHSQVQLYGSYIKLYSWIIFITQNIRKSTSKEAPQTLDVYYAFRVIQIDYSN